MTLKLAAEVTLNAAGLVAGAAAASQAIGGLDAAARRAGAGAAALGDGAAGAGAQAGAMASAATAGAQSARELQLEANNSAAAMQAASSAAFGLVDFVRRVGETSAEYQKLNAMLVTATGSTTAAAQAFGLLKRFAADTPYGLAQVTDGFIKLKNLGLDASIASMRAYGDFASAMGKPLMQMVEAVADAATGEFERLKEFGIRAETEGAKIRFTFRGVETEVANSAGAITKYLTDIGRIQFAGQMEQQSKTLGGAFSNLGDAIGQALDTVGQGGVAAELQSIAEALSLAANGGEAAALSLGAGLAAGLKTGREAAAWLADNLHLAAGGAAALASSAAINGVIGLAGALRTAGGAAAALNAALLANPVTAAAVGIGAAAAAIVQYGRAAATAEAKNRLHNQTIADLDGIARRGALGLGELTDAQKALDKAAQESAAAQVKAAEAEIAAIEARIKARDAFLKQRLLPDPFQLAYRVFGQNAPGSPEASQAGDQAALAEQTRRLEELRAALAAARVAMTSVNQAADPAADSAATLSKQFRAASEAAGVAATSQGLVSKATSEAEGHIATLNRVLALSPAEMAKLGTSAGDVARIMDALKLSIDPVAAAIDGMNKQIALARAGDGAERAALADLQKLNDERKKALAAPLSTVSPEYLQFLNKAKALETARVEGAMKSGKIVDLEKQIAAARAAGNQAAALRLEREKAVADMVERGVDPTVAATKANQDYAVSMAGLSAAGAQWEKGQNAAILAAERLAKAQALGAEAVREAEIVNRAAAQAEAERVALDSARGQAILAKVRAEERWKQAASESAALRAANDNLADLKAEIALSGQSAAVRERAVRSIQIQRQAVEQFGGATSDAAKAWIGLQEEIADVQAIQRFREEVDRVAEDIAGDLATAMFEGFAGSETNIMDWFRGLLKRMAIEIVKQQFILPITTQIVSAVPGLFGISSPVTGAQAAQAQQGGLGSTGDLLSLGSKFAPSSWTNGLMSSLDTWGYNALGIGTMATTTSSMMTAGAGGLAANLGVMPMAGGVSNAAAVGSTTATAGSLTGGLSAYLGSAGVGALGGFLGGMLGTAANSKAVGALSGAALGAGGAGLASYLGFSAAGGPVGLAIGALAGALTGALGTSKKPKTEASAYANMTEGGVITGADTGSRYQDAGPVIAARDAVTASVQALVTAGATFDGVSVNIRAMGDNWETRSQGLDGYKVSTSDDVGTIVRDYVRWAASDAADVLGKGRPALGLSDIGRRAAASATTTGEDYIATIALAEQVAAGAAALQDFDKSLGGITAAAKKAAAEGFKPLADELVKASDGGFAGEYRALVAGQMRQVLDQMAAPVEYSALEQAMASAAGEMAALRQASVDLGLGLEGAVDAAEAAVKSRLLGQANDEIAAAIDEAAGRGYRNSARDIQAEFGATARTLAALGGDGARALDLAGAKLTALLGGLDEAAALDAVSLLTGDLAALGMEALAAARASQTAAAAQEAAARAAETQARAAKINEDLQIRLLRAGGDAAAADALAAALTRSREAAEFAAAGYDAATLALLAQVQAAEEAAAASAQAAALREEATAAALQRRRDADTIYIGALGDVAAAARSAVANLRGVASSLRDLPGRLALDKDLSILDPRGRLDEAWRQIGAALNDALGGERLGPDVLTRARGGEASAAAQIDAALRAGVVSADAAARVEALIQAALTAGRDYYADLPAYSADYQYLTGLADSLAAAAESSAAGLDSEAAAIDRQIVALGGAAAATERSITSMGDLRGAVEAAAAAWATGKTAGANDNSQEAILRAAMAQSGYRYDGGFSGGAWSAWLTNTMAASPQQWGADNPLLSQAVAAVTGYKGDFGQGGALAYVKSNAVTELQREAAREVLRRFGEVPTFATGGDHVGGLRLVGEMGPELEATGASRIHNAVQTQQILRGAMAPDMGPVTAAISAGASATVRAIDASAGRIVGVVERLEAEVGRLQAVVKDQSREIRDLSAALRRAI